MDDTDLCECGHVYDDHDKGGPCAVVLWALPPLGQDVACECIHFDLADPAGVVATGDNP